MVILITGFYTGPASTSAYRNRVTNNSWSTCTVARVANSFSRMRVRLKC
jgi:hypothetical protein